jgi:hypothetical protein
MLVIPAVDFKFQCRLSRESHLSDQLKPPVGLNPQDPEKINRIPGLEL